jgi:ABC-type maltose transport system permease subunit
LEGVFFNNKLIAPGALLALPTLIIYFDLQRQFVLRGLTLGATKG